MKDYINLNSKFFGLNIKNTNFSMNQLILTDFNLMIMQMNLTTDLFN